MGSGAFIKLSILRKYGGFPKYNDDLLLGSILRINKEKVVTIPFYNKVSVVFRAKDNVNQLKRIYYGLFTTINIL